MKGLEGTAAGTETVLMEIITTTAENRFVTLEKEAVRGIKIILDIVTMIRIETEVGGIGIGAGGGTGIGIEAGVGIVTGLQIEIVDEIGQDLVVMRTQVEDLALLGVTAGGGVKTVMTMRTTKVEMRSVKIETEGVIKTDRLLYDYSHQNAWKMLCPFVSCHFRSVIVVQ